MSTFDILDQIKQNFDKYYIFSAIEKMKRNSKFGVFVIKMILHLLHQFKRLIKSALKREQNHLMNNISTFVTTFKGFLANFVLRIVAILINSLNSSKKCNESKYTNSFS